MRWELKALTQRAIDVLPSTSATRVNYWLQRHVSRSLPVPDGEFDVHFDAAAAHLRRIEPFVEATGNPGDLRGFEFGVGWDLIGPLTLAALGVGHQVLVDVRPLARVDLVNDTLARLARRHDELESRAGRALRSLGTTPISSLGDLSCRFGIEYRAPVDARCTGLTAGGFDLITSTFTMEHIPRADLRAVLRECARLLAPGGALSGAIDMHDHFCYVDPEITAYNFLRFGDRAWRALNSSLNYQNRLRARDYHELIDAAGLHMLEFDHLVPGEKHRRGLAELPLAPHFRNDFEMADLAPTIMTFVAGHSRTPCG